MYLAEDSDFDIYMDECKKKQIELGYTESAEKGTCPLLCAEHLERQARWKLLEEAEYLTKIDSKQCVKLEIQRKLEELTLKLCVPFIEKDEVLKSINL